MGYLENLWNALDFGSLWDLLLRLVSVFLCLTVHETCHGLAALALGDPTAKPWRLSLNPLRHIDWFGLLMMVTVGFGWAKPVPVQPGISASQAGHGPDGAGRADVQLPAGAGAAVCRAAGV